MDTYVALVDNLKLSGILSLEEINLACEYFKFENLERDGFFIEIGKRCSRLAFLDTGILRTFVYDLNGEEIVKYFVEGHILFTDIESYENSTPAKISIQAITECQLFSINKKDNYTLQTKLPKWEHVLKYFAANALSQMITHQNFLRIGSAIDQYKYFIEHFPNLAQNVPLKYIASYLGITQSSLSRIRKQ